MRHVEIVNVAYPNRKAIREIDEKRFNIRIYEKFVADTIGFKKIYTVLLFFNYYAKTFVRNNEIKKHRPHLCLTPDNIVVFQWQKIILKFPDLILIITHGDKSMNAVLAKNWISVTAMKKTPIFFKNWSKHLQLFLTKKILKSRIWWFF